MARLLIIAFLSLWTIACTAKKGGGGGSSSAPKCQSISIDVHNRSMAGISWTPFEGSEALIIDGDDSNRNVVNEATRGTNSKFEGTDAYYEGYMTMVLTPPTSGNQSRCKGFTYRLNDGAYLRIGSQDPKRKAYDPNPFYLEFGRTTSCAVDTDVNFESSNDAFTNGQVWSLAYAVPAGGTEMNFSGNLTSTKANSGNYFQFEYAYGECPSRFFLRSMMQYNKVSLSGTASRSVASMKFTIASGPVPTGSGTVSGLNPPVWPEGWVADGTFQGSSWEKVKGGILTLKDGTLTTGKKPVNKTVIIVASSVGAVALIALSTCCWCCCVRPLRRRRREKQKEEQVAMMSY